MSSWPPTLVTDWGALMGRLRAGDTVCLVHGLVDAAQAPIGIPICPHCRQAVMVTAYDRRGQRRFVEPAPKHCAAAEQHPLAGGRMTVGWTGCSCPHATPGPGGHRTWSCRDCTDLGRGPSLAQRWPPCDREPSRP